MTLFERAENNAIEKTRARILWFILALSVAGEVGLTVLDLARDGEITNNLVVLFFLFAAAGILASKRIALAGYVALTPFGVDFIRATAENGIDSHALPLLFLLVVEVVYFLPTFHALFFVGVLMAAFNGVLLTMTPEADFNQVGKLLVVANAIVVGITALFITVLLSMRRYFSELSEQNEHLDELVRHRTSDLEAERQKSERLLHSILPQQIVQRIKGGEVSPVDRIEDASVLFADLSGFTSLAQEMEPDDLVALLNEIFSEMDRLADRHGLEKIKTIGDAYMVAAGVPEPQSDGLEKLGEFALDLRDLFHRKNETGRSIGLRIGMHHGPVTAGVIGQRKLMYDLWGETVNIASRMESHGVEGQIQTTQAVRDRLSDRYEFLDRGHIKVNGVGSVPAWILEGRRVSLRAHRQSAEKA